MLDMTEIYDRNTLSDGRQNCFMANKFDYFMDSSVITCAARRIHLQEYLSLEEDKPKVNFESLEDLKHGPHNLRLCTHARPARLQQNASLSPWMCRTVP